MAGDKTKAKVQTLIDLMRWIRDYASNPRHQEPLLSNSFGWHQLCAAFDAVEDTELATDAYLEGDFPTQPGERYLRVYGVLQALVVQQDALRDMTGILCPGIPLKLVDVLRDVRDARHASVGHPTRKESKGDVSFHFISRITLSKDHFQLLSYSKKDGSSSAYIRVRKLIDQQRAETGRILSEVIAELKQKDEEHKNLFRGKSMTGPFHLVTYAIEKIFEDLRKKTIIGMGKWGADHLKTVLDDFEKMLADRGLSIETYDSIEYERDQIVYPLAELQKFFAGAPSDIGSYQAAIVYGDALQGYFSELMKSAQWIDEEYEKASAVGSA